MNSNNTDSGNTAVAAELHGNVPRRKFGNSEITLPLLGFGMMRLPAAAPDSVEIDYPTAERMVDEALRHGVNYFDTAYVYNNGLSEKFCGDVLSAYPREQYMIATKMPIRCIRRKDDLEQFFDTQLKRTRAGYFDFYLLHNINKERWQTSVDFEVYEFLEKKKEEGLIRNLGFSFHDEPEVLETVAAAQKWDFVQIQLNYYDWKATRAREQYEILTRNKLPVIVMEPVRGGTLATLNPEAAGILREAAPDASPASWALRFAASFPNVVCVLSGMTRPEHVHDNLKTMTAFKPVSEDELRVIDRALSALHKSMSVPCTGCRYCVPCPAGVNIPRVFALYNQYKASGAVLPYRMAYEHMDAHAKASACKKCGACLEKCPQRIKIPDELEKIEAEAQKIFV